MCFVSIPPKPSSGGGAAVLVRVVRSRYGEDTTWGCLLATQRPIVELCLPRLAAQHANHTCFKVYTNMIQNTSSLFGAAQTCVALIRKSDFLCGEHPPPRPYSRDKHTTTSHARHVVFVFPLFPRTVFQYSRTAQSQSNRRVIFFMRIAYLLITPPTISFHSWLAGM